MTLRVNNSEENKVMEYVGFEKFTSKRIQALLDCYLKETFLYSSFGRFNKKQDIEFYSNPIITSEDLCIINSGVRNTKGEVLKIK